MVTTLALVRWIVFAAILGFSLATLVHGPTVDAQTRVTTWFGCTSITACTGTANIPVLVDSSGNLQVVGQ